MNDYFSNEIEKIKKLEKLIKSDIQKRDDQEKNNVPTSIIEIGIKGLFLESSNLLRNLSENITKENSKTLPQNEINRRLNIVQDIINKLEKLKLNYEKNISKSLMEKNKQNLLLTTEENMGEDNLQNFSSSEIVKLQQDKIKRQDDMLDECYGLLVTSRKANREIESEIKNQKPILEDLEKQMDRVDGRMNRAKEKLNQYVEKSSNNCLLTALCLQLVLMLILILS